MTPILQIRQPRHSKILRYAQGETASEMEDKDSSLPVRFQNSYSSHLAVCLSLACNQEFSDITKASVNAWWRKNQFVFIPELRGNGELIN